MPRDNTQNRIASVKRTTKETDISILIDLDGSGAANINTGIGFFDHMLEQLARHSLIDMDISVKGDLHIDGHHTVEDTALALGEALKGAIGDKTGIVRYGHAYVPMDEALARVTLDLSGRAYFIWNVDFNMTYIGDLDTELIKHFFQSLAVEGGITLHVENLYGENNHHIVEGVFKAAAKALRMAVSIDERAVDQLPSTKGAL